MSAKKKKRRFTFRKGQLIPCESGSIMHQLTKTERETGKTGKTIASVLHPAKKKSKKRKRR